MHILPNISRSKGNQTMKLSPVKIITQETFFLKNHTQNVVEKLFPDPVLVYQNWAYLWVNSLKFYTVCFDYMTSSVLSQYIEANQDCFLLT